MGRRDPEKKGDGASTYLGLGFGSENVNLNVKAESESVKSDQGLDSYGWDSGSVQILIF